MAIRTQCPHCSAVFKVSEQALGRKAKCKRCEQPFTVTEGAQSPPAPAKAGAGSAVATGPSEDGGEAVDFGVIAPTKKCPHCAKTIKAKAKKCRFCGKRLDAHGFAADSGPEPTDADVYQLVGEGADPPTNDLSCPSCGTQMGRDVVPCPCCGLNPASDSPVQTTVQGAKAVNEYVIYFCGMAAFSVVFVIVLALAQLTGATLLRNVALGIVVAFVVVPGLSVLYSRLFGWMRDSMRAMGEGAGCMLALMYGPVIILIGPMAELFSAIYRLYLTIFGSFTGLLGFKPRVPPPA